ncbi:MAG: hypothetical protein R3335_12520, partial [Anaerolineales bacterium]|nr:hypothetical protein [Anaerolineales bacterium]
DLRSGSYAGNSKIVIRNNGSKTARVNTTIFNGNYNNVHQRHSHSLGPKKIVEIDPAGSLDHASALVVASQDISVMVRQELPGSVYASYLGVSEPTSEVFVPLVHRKNSGWSSQLHIQNAGFTRAEVTIQFKPWGGLGTSCTMNESIKPYLTKRIDLQWVGENCLTNAKEPVFVGSATITSSNSQPLAVTYPQQKRLGSSIVSLMESGKTGAAGTTTYAPLIQNFNSYYKVISGIAAQNTNTAANLIQRRFRNSGGPICAAWITSVAGRYSLIDVQPPGQSGGCAPVLTARIKNLNGVGVSATVNQFWSGASPYPDYWTDYPAVSNPATTVIIPWWNDQSGWDSALVIRNTSGSSASGNVRFYYANGLLAGSPVPFSLAGNGYAIVDAPVGGLKGSARVTSSQKVAVVVNHFNPSSGGDKIMSNIGDHKP